MIRFILSISVTFLISFNAFGQSLSLVKKDMWGSSEFDSALYVGDYLYVLNEDGRLDVLDPQKKLDLV